VPVNRFRDYLARLRTVDANRREIKDEPPTPVVVVGFPGSDDSFNAPADTSGRMPVVEQNSSSTLTNVAAHTNSLRYGLFGGGPLFGVAPSATSAIQHRILAVDATCTAGGELSATTLVDALTSYTGYCYIEGVWSDQTDAGAVCTITGGTPTPITVVTNANTFTALGIWLQGTADATAIQISAAAGQFQANQVLQFQGTFHYET